MFDSKHFTISNQSESILGGLVLLSNRFRVNEKVRSYPFSLIHIISQFDRLFDINRRIGGVSRRENVLYS